MTIELNGFDELINDLNNLGNVGNKIGKKAVEEGAKIVLKQQKHDAPRSDDNDHGADHLEVTQVKKYSKSGTCLAKIGISKENWQYTKGLYFQHYGYEHYRSGELVNKHIGWMTDSFKKCIDDAEKLMIDVASQEIDKVLK